MEDLLFVKAKTTHNAPTWPDQTREKTSEISKEGFASGFSLQKIDSRKFVNKCALTLTYCVYMGHFAQDGENEPNVSYDFNF